MRGFAETIIWGFNHVNLLPLMTGNVFADNERKMQDSKTKLHFVKLHLEVVASKTRASIKAESDGIDFT